MSGSSPPHRVTSVDRERRVGVCAVCGPTLVRVRADRQAVECITLRRLNRGKGGKVSPETRRRYKLRKKYGVKDVADISADPTTCPICLRRDQKMHVDHDHSCCPGKTTCGGCVRGFICQDCNWALGRFRDDVQALKRAIAYLGS